VTLKPLALADEPGGVNHYWRANPDGTGDIVTVQDVAPILDACKAQKNFNDGYSKSRDLRRVMFIPDGLRAKIINEEGWDPFRPDLYPEKMARLINDPDYAHFRTAEGRVGVTNGRVR
jgi:hypothetical protein